MKKIFASKYLTMFILGVWLCLPSLADADWGRHPGPDGWKHALFKTVITSLLGMTDEQQEALDEIRAETKDAIKPLAEEIKTLQLPDIMLAEEINIDLARETMEQVVELKSEIASIGAAAKLEGVQILTADQRQLIWTFVGTLLDLLEYILAYDGWDEIKAFIEAYIKPVLADICPHRIDLNLTSEQKDALNQLKTETKNQIEPRVEEIKALGILEALLAQEIDTDLAAGKLNEMVGIQSQITDMVLNAKLEGSQILTPEQRAILLEKINERREHPIGQ